MTDSVIFGNTKNLKIESQEGGKNQSNDYDTVQTHYETIMCLKKTHYGPKKSADTNGYLNQSKIVEGRDDLKHLCVLPKGHQGKCSHKFTTFFKKTERGTNEDKIVKKIIGSIDCAIYSTPGNDDYVYKNRASRLYCHAISNEEQKKIRDKTIKKKCAIPKKDMSTPILLAHAALDWMIYIISVENMKKYLHSQTETELYKKYLDTHKLFLIEYFSKYNRKVFDEHGNTICCIKCNKLRIEDVADIDRDNRVDIRDTDLQMGHNIPRSDDYITIRGCNLLPQTRRGNLLIGENIFTEDSWINELEDVVKPYRK